MNLRIVRNNYLAVAALLASAIPVSAQDDEVLRLLLGDGPFEVVGDNGLFGFVVARYEAKTTVRFKPCYGPAFDIETEKLKRTTINCDGAPSPETHPLKVDCEAAERLRLAQYKALEAGVGTMIGTIYEVEHDTLQAADEASSAEISAAFADVEEFKVCGDWTVGYTAAGAAAVTIVPVPAAQRIQVDELNKEQE